MLTKSPFSPASGSEAEYLYEPVTLLDLMLTVNGSDRA